MNPFNLFLALVLLGVLLVGGAVVVSECRDAELVVLPATVTATAIVVRERTEAITVPPCPACPGGESGGPRTVTTVVQEATFLVTLDVVENGRVSQQRLEVSDALYRKLAVGDTVEWRVRRGIASGRLCSRPEILVPEPAR